MLRIGSDAGWVPNLNPTQCIVAEGSLGGEMGPEPLQRGHEGTEGKGRGDEGNAEAERIDEQQENAPADGIFAGGHEQDGREHRPDAGRPAEGEGKADQISADEPHGPRIGVVARLAVQNRNVDQSESLFPAAT
jgi:hypothetical protein